LCRRDDDVTPPPPTSPGRSKSARRRFAIAAGKNKSTHLSLSLRT